MAKKRSISLRTLAKELDAEIADIVRRCDQEGVKSADWIETTNLRIGRVNWKGQVRAGLAETIREWHREGFFRKLRSDGQYVADLVLLAAQEAEGHQCTAFGDELQAIVLLLKRREVDLHRPRGREMVWDAWKLFVGSRLDYEHWLDCPSCGVSYKPDIDRRFADNFIHWCITPRRKQTAQQRNVLHCENCRRQTSKSRKRLKQ